VTIDETLRGFPERHSFDDRILRRSFRGSHRSVSGRQRVNAVLDLSE
jgi:hypothetical protein